MDNPDKLVNQEESSVSWFRPFLFLLWVLLGFQVIGPLLGFGLLLPMLGFDMTLLEEIFANPLDAPQYKWTMFFLQGFASTIGLIVFPWYYLKYYAVAKIRIPIRSLSFPLISISILIVLSFMPVNAVFITWNEAVSFPEFLSGFEQWAREKENYLKEITRFLTDLDGWGAFAMALIVIAVIPAIGEEFAFRGILQIKFLRITGNIHLAIWISAILFSAIHIQFFGFVPRVLLGALFGYMYYYSGNLIVPITAHFINNAFTLFMFHAYQKGWLEFDLESLDYPPLSTVLIFCIITAGLWWIFINIVRGSKANG